MTPLRSIVNALEKIAAGAFTRRRGKPDPTLPEAPLAGAPLRPRVKTYSAQSGYVYQYVYRGYREDEGGTTYVFSVTRNRRDWIIVRMVLNHEILRTWEARHGRTLRGVDRYAIAKLALFEYFDETTGDGVSPREPSVEDIERYLQMLEGA